LYQNVFLIGVLNLITVEKRLRQARLQKFVRIISGNYKLRLSVINSFKHPGACVYDTDEDGRRTSQSIILITSSLSKDKKQNLIFQKGVSLHELGHDLFTDSPRWRASGVNDELGNLIEDGRVEEAISRLYPKARVYFYLTNKELNKRPILLPHAKRAIYNLIIREAKRTTGIPQLTEGQHKQIINKIGKDIHDEILRLTRLAVEASGEDEAIRITKQLEDLLNKKQLTTEEINDSSLVESGEADMEMPEMDEESKELIKEILEKIGSNDDSPELPDLGLSEEEPDKSETESLNVRQNLDDIEEEINDEVTNEVVEENTAAQSSGVVRNFGAYGIGEGNQSIQIDTEKIKPIKTAPLQNTSKSVAHSLKVIAEKGRKGWQTNQKKGRLNMKSVINSVTNNNTRVFKNRIKPEPTDLSAVILLDASGSMGGAQSRRATETAYIISKAMELSNFNSEVVQFGSNTTKSINGIKSFNQKIKYAEEDFIPLSHGSTPLFDALEGAEKSIEQVTSKRKVIFVATDGAPDDTISCQRKIKELENKGIIVVGLLINSFDNNNLFKHKLSCNNIVELQSKMQTVIKDVLRTIKRS